jgi:hypothetical protein
MSKEAPNRKRDLIWCDVKVNQAKAAVAIATIVEIKIAGEKGGMSELWKQRKNLVVLHPRAANIAADLPGRDATIVQ